MTAAEPLDAERLAAILEEHPNLGDGFCSQCDADWPCLTYRLAADADGQRFSATILAEEVGRLSAEVERLQEQEQRLRDLAAMNRKHAGFNNPDEPPVMVPCSIVAEDIERALDGGS